MFTQKGFPVIFNPVQYLPEKKNIQLTLLSQQHREILKVRIKQLQRYCFVLAMAKHMQICQSPFQLDRRYMFMEGTGQLELLDFYYSIYFEV